MSPKIIGSVAIVAAAGFMTLALRNGSVSTGSGAIAGVLFFAGLLVLQMGKKITR